MLSSGEMMELKEGTHTVRTDLGLSHCPQMWTTPFSAPPCYFIFSTLETPRQAQGSPVGTKQQSQTLMLLLERSLPSMLLTRKSWCLLTPYLGKQSEIPGLGWE